MFLGDPCEKVDLRGYDPQDENYSFVSNLLRAVILKEFSI